MKFKIQDQVIVTIGKDKGKKGEITQVFPKENKVLVKDLNLYVKHVKPMPMINRVGERTVQERPLDTAKIAILNEEGQPHRIGYRIGPNGSKERIFKKTGTKINYQKSKTKKETKKKPSKKIDK